MIMSISNIENEREKDIIESVATIRSDMLKIDHELAELIRNQNWRNDYHETRKELAQLRGLFSRDIRLVDKLDANVFYEEKADLVTFRTQSEGGKPDRDVVKSENSDSDLIHEILNGDVRVGNLVKTLRKKYE